MGGVEEPRRAEDENVYDLVIRDALIVDGTGAKPVHGDLGVTSGRIVAIEKGLGPARETIDTGGLALAPGIIDGHTHYDAQITWDPFVDPSPALGVTTVVIGNCGFTIAPCRPADRDLTMRNLTHVEGMSLDALRAGIRWDFETFPQYLEMLERNGVGPNVAAFIGHSSLRTFVLRDDAARRVARDDEIETMRHLVREAMAAGAVGFATSTSEPHNGENGVPMPSRLADDRELRGLVTAMGEAGRGVFMLTKGSKTTIPYLETIAADSRRPIVIAALFHSNTNPESVFRAFADINAARARGNMLWAQTSCCPLTMDFTLRNPYLFEGLIAWKPAMEAHGDNLAAVYRDPKFRDAVKAELAAARGMRLFNSEWDRVNVIEGATPATRGLEGRSIADIAGEQAKHPLDCILELALSEDLATAFTAELLHNDEPAVARLLREPDAHISLSDAGAHLTFLCDAGFGLHLLGHWGRELGVLSLEEATRRLTGQPAKIFGIRDRGRLAPGLAADLILFDPATVGRGAKRRVFDLPAGAQRLTTPAVGLHGVWVNGTRIVDQAGLRSNAARPGKVLRDFAA